MAPKWIARLFGRIQTEVHLAFKFRSEPLGVKVLADTQTSHDEAVSAVLLCRPTRIVRVSVLDYRFAKWGTIDVRNREVYLGERMLVGSVGGTGRLGCVLAVAEFFMSKGPYEAAE